MLMMTGGFKGGQGGVGVGEMSRIVTGCGAKNASEMFPSFEPPKAPTLITLSGERALPVFSKYTWEKFLIENSKPGVFGLLNRKKPPVFCGRGVPNAGMRMLGLTKASAT